MRFRFALVAGVLLASASALMADFQYEQTTKITGGVLMSMARFGGKRLTEPQTSTIAVKGNRMVHLSPQSAQITDLDKETITHVDFEKKTYSVMTFQQMKEMMQQAMEGMQKREGTGAGDASVTFTATVKETGQKKAVNGMNANEYILTMVMNATDQKSGQNGAINITNDMWMAPEVPGYQEVRDFELRMAEKLGIGLGGSNPLASMRPGMGAGMAEMAKQMSKLKGIPVMQVTRMGSTADGKPLPAASEAPELSQQSQVNVGDAGGHAAGDAAAGAAAGAVLGRLPGMGGLGGFGRKKPKEQPQEQPQQQQQQQQAKAAPGGGLLMETTAEMSSFSSAPVDGSKFDVPSGFKQVQSDLEKRRK